MPYNVSMMKKMSYQQWFETYRPIREEHFETYGTAVEFVRTQDPCRIWTYATNECDYIVNGWHVINRIGYFITEIPFLQGEEIYVFWE